jgi:hypothetical protein
MMMLARVGPKGEPIATPSICFEEFAVDGKGGLGARVEQ